MHRKLSTFLFIVGAFLFLNASNILLAEQAGPDNSKNSNGHSPLCDVKILPTEVAGKLNAFDSWQIQDEKYLSVTAKERWEAETPMSCPGIAIGYFGAVKRLSFAVLLRPIDRNTPGYKLIVFTNEPSKAFEPVVIDQSDKSVAANFFIHKIRIADFFDVNSVKKYQIGSKEGILFVDAGDEEYEADVYYWTKGKYQHSFVDY